jgi:hypothetical protein
LSGIDWSDAERLLVDAVSGARIESIPRPRPPLRRKPLVKAMFTSGGGREHRGDQNAQQVLMAPPFLCCG